MENASKALLMAAGVFLALLIISVMIYMSDSITKMGEAQESKKAAEQLAAFNAQYEVYNKKLMYGTDIITVINKAEEDGTITIKVKDKDDSEFSDLKDLKDALTSNMSDSTKGSATYEGLRIFECTEISYESNPNSGNYGKVNKMTFKEKNI